METIITEIFKKLRELIAKRCCIHHVRSQESSLFKKGVKNSVCKKCHHISFKFDICFILLCLSFLIALIPLELLILQWPSNSPIVYMTFLAILLNFNYVLRRASRHLFSMNHESKAVD